MFTLNPKPWWTQGLEVHRGRGLYRACRQCLNIAFKPHTLGMLGNLGPETDNILPRRSLRDVGVGCVRLASELHAYRKQCPRAQETKPKGPSRRRNRKPQTSTLQPKLSNPSALNRQTPYRNKDLNPKTHCSADPSSSKPYGPKASPQQPCQGNGGIEDLRSLHGY